MIKLDDTIDKDLWIDPYIPLDFDFFAIDDVMLDYMVVLSKLPKFNNKINPSYIFKHWIF